MTDQYEELNMLLANEAANLESQLGENIPSFDVWLSKVKKEWWVDDVGNGIKSSVLNLKIPGKSQTVKTVVEYGLQQTALETSPIGLRFVRSGNDIVFLEQLKSAISNLRINIQHVLRCRNRDEYVRISEHKLVATEGFTEGQSFPMRPRRFLWWKWQTPVRPTQRLNCSILNRILKGLSDNGVQKKPYLLTASDLECPGFIIEDPLPGAQRWKIKRRKWVEVPEYINKNGALIVNPEYKNAPFEDSIVFLPEVFTVQHPRPLSKPDADPASYAGSIRWLNIPDREDNPDGDIGCYRVVLASASKPVRPELGWVIRHLRN